MDVLVVAKLIFMRLTNYKNELETKHSYHAFIMQMCMMIIFVVCFLYASCGTLKRYVLQGTYLF